MSKIRCNFVDSCRTYQYMYSDFMARILSQNGVHGNSHNNIIWHMKSKSLSSKGGTPPYVPYHLHFNVLYNPCNRRLSYSKYCITVNFQGRKLSQIRRKWEFLGENFHGLLETKHKWMWYAPKFREENFRGWLSNLKIRKSFLPRSFPLYGMEANVQS